MFISALVLLSLGAQTPAAAEAAASQPALSQPTPSETPALDVTPGDEDVADEEDQDEGFVVAAPEQSDDRLSFINIDFALESVFRRSADAAFKQTLSPSLKAGWNNEFLPGWLTHIGGGIGLYQEGGGTDRIRVEQLGFEATGQTNMGPFFGARHATLWAYALAGVRGGASLITRKIDDDSRQTFFAAGGLYTGAGASMRLFFINTRLEYSVGFFGPAFDSRALFSLGLAF